MQGWLHVVEGVRQMRHAAGVRQVKGAETAWSRVGHDLEHLELSDSGEDLMSAEFTPIPAASELSGPFGRRVLTAYLGFSDATRATTFVSRSTGSVRDVSPQSTSGRA